MPRPASYSTRAPACASREYAGWRTPEATSEVAVDRAPVERRPRRPCRARPLAAIRAGAPSRRSTTAADLDAGALEPAGDARERALVGADHDRPPARADRPLVDEPLDGRGEHHADEVVAGEHERLLDRARRDDDPARADPMEDGAGVDRDEPALVDAECTRGREHVVRPLAGLAARGRATSSTRPPAAAAARPPRVRSARRRRRGRPRGDARRRGAAACAAPVDAAEARELPQHALVDGPEAPRPDHRAVVEARPA